MELTIYTDGGSINNPGPAAYGFLIYSGTRVVCRQKKTIGNASNNVAEYMGLICALEYIVQKMPQDIKQTGKIRVISDSLLMVKQVSGEYKVKNENLKQLHTRVKVLEMEIGIPIVYLHVFREKNKEADSLVKEALGEYK